MTEFWESNFRDKQAMWGFKPADSAIRTLTLFQKHNLNKILIPGFGYGRNAQIFAEKGFEVTGIEISGTAIGLAKDQYGDDIQIHHGDVTGMPFDDKIYDGIFCYALIHLLNPQARFKFIRDCYNQLRPDGYMVFVAISTNDLAYGKGKKTGANCFLTPHGIELFFYDQDSIAKEFGEYGLLETKEVNEPTVSTENKPPRKFWQIVCKK